MNRLRVRHLLLLAYIITNIITAMLPFLVAAALLFTVYALSLHATKSEAEKETETQEKEMQQETQPEPEDVFTETQPNLFLIILRFVRKRDF